MNAGTNQSQAPRQPTPEEVLGYQRAHEAIAWVLEFGRITPGEGITAMMHLIALQIAHGTEPDKRGEAVAHVGITIGQMVEEAVRQAAQARPGGVHT